LSAQCLTAIDRNRIHAEGLVLEIAEGVLLSDPKRVRVQLEALQAMGFGISIDDFGTGYSSRNRLRIFPTQELKIDRGIIEASDIRTAAGRSSGPLSRWLKSLICAQWQRALRPRLRPNSRYRSVAPSVGAFFTRDLCWRTMYSAVKPAQRLQAGHEDRSCGS